MKKFAFILLAIITFISGVSLPKPAYASSKYARVINDTTAFYSDQFGLNPVFYLPYTYYVKVLDDSGEFMHVECVGEHLTCIDGYVKKSEVFFDDLPVSSSYVNLKLTTCDTACLYEDFNFDVISQYVFSGRYLDYYGSYVKPNGLVLYYVGYNGRLGYVSESFVSPFTITNHPNPLTFITETVKPDTPDTPIEDEKPSSNENFFNIKFVIIFCLIFAGIVGLFIAFSRKSPQKKEAVCGYYDENDFE